jgi:ammonium transporter, Amt family
MLCAGCVRKKNIQNTLMKNLLDACGASIAFFCVGYAFAFGGTKGENAETSKTFIGTTNFFLIDVDDLAFWFFQYVFSAAAGEYSLCGLLWSYLYNKAANLTLPFRSKNIDFPL